VGHRGQTAGKGLRKKRTDLMATRKGAKGPYWWEREWGMPEGVSKGVRRKEGEKADQERVSRQKEIEAERREGMSDGG